MNNQSSEINPDDAKWRCRDLCMQRGAVPDLKKGELCWLFFCNTWHSCTVKGRLAGGVYRCQINRPFMGCNELVACANNFGGIIH